MRGGGASPRRILVVKRTTWRRDDGDSCPSYAQGCARRGRDRPSSLAACSSVPRLSARHARLAYDSPRYRRGTAGTDGASLGDAVRGRYDVVVELRGEWRTLLLPFRTGAWRRVDRGTVRLREWIRRRLSLNAERHRAPLHEVETNYEIVRPLLASALPSPGLRTPAPRIGPAELHVRGAARDTLSQRLTAAGVDPARPMICIHPGASWRPRAWLPERFAAIADWVGEHYHAQIVLLGSAEERDVEAAVLRHARNGRVTSLFGTLSLPEVAALLQCSRLLVGNDSGIAHLAAAWGTPTVALFGPQNRAVGPWSPVITLHHPFRLPCARLPSSPGGLRELSDRESDGHRALIGPTTALVPPRAARVNSRRRTACSRSTATFVAPSSSRRRSHLRAWMAAYWVLPPSSSPPPACRSPHLRPLGAVATPVSSLDAGLIVSLCAHGAAPRS